MPFHKIRKALDKRAERRKEGRRKREEERKREREAFDQIEFPILAIDDKGLHHLFHNSQETVNEPDLYLDVWEYGEMSRSARLVDSRGRIFTWRYSDILQTYHPGSQEGVLTVDAMREMLEKYFGDLPGKPAFGGEKSVKELFRELNGYV